MEISLKWRHFPFSENHEFTDYYTFVHQNTAESVVWGCFHPQDVRTLVTYGRRHVFFWRLFWDTEQGIYKVLRDKKSGLFEVSGIIFWDYFY